MAKVLIGNIKGPQGEPGPQGIQGIQGPQGETGAQGNAGPQGVAGPKGETGAQGPKGETGQRGSKWYTGEAIDGISTTPAVYATGLSDVMAEDYYMNVDNGHIYRCTEGGDADTAKWMFVGDINSVSQEELQELYEYIYDIDAINEVSGTSLLVPDGTDSEAADFIAYGRSEQVQYSGKNLFDIVIEPSVTDTDISCNITEPITISAIAQNVAVSSAVWRVGVTYQDGTIEYVGDSGYSLGAFPKTFTASESNPIIKLTYRGGTSTMTSGKYLVQVEKGTTATEYEPYVGGVASPNPDYPQAIKSVADSGWFDGELLQGFYSGTGVFISNSTYVCSRNPIPCNSGDTIKLAYGTTASEIAFIFYDKDMVFISRPYCVNATEYETTTPTNAKYVHFYLREPNISITPTTVKKIVVTINDTYALKVKSVGKNLLKVTNYLKISGVEIVTLEDNKFIIGSGSSGYGVRFSNDDIGLKAGKTYAFSVKTISGNVNGGYRLHYTDNTYSKTFGVNTIFTAEKEVAYVLFYVGMPYSGDTDIVISDLQIEENTEVTDYEPYKETVTYIPLNEPLRGSLDGTVTDEVSLTEVTRRFGKFVLNGTEKWYFTANTNMYMSLGGWLKPNGIVISDYYTVNRTKAENTILVNSTNVIIYDKRFATVDEWKAHLQANPVTLIYELAEPIVEEIDPASITIYDGVTHITATDNPEMYVEYYCDSGIGHRLAETIKEMRAEHVELNDRIGATSGRVTEVEKSVDKTSIKIDALNEAVGISKNLLRVTKTGDATTSGVTYAIDADKNYIFSGTATADISIKVYGGLAITSVPITESVIVSGCPEGGSENTYYAYAMISDDNSSEKYIDTGNECTYEYVEGSNASVNAYYIVIKAGTNVAGLVFKPMVRLASEADGTYEPNKGNAISMIKKKDRRALYNATGQATAILDYDWQNYNFITFCRDSSVGLQMPITLDPAGLYSSGGKVVYYLTNNTSAWVNISFPEEGKIKLEQSNAMVGVGDNYYYHVTGFMQIS